MKVRGLLCFLVSLTFAFLAAGRTQAYKKVPIRITRDTRALTLLENHTSENIKVMEELTTLVNDMLKERRASLCCYDVVTQEDWLSLSLRSALYTTIVSLSRLQDASNEYRLQLNHTCDSCDLTPTYTRCNVTDHRCPSDPDKCISYFQQCDGEADCGDASDEELNICKKNPCGEGILCDKQQVCIPSDYKCDGRTDCSDGSDELCTRPRTDVPPTIATTATPTQTCRDDQFQCLSNILCITQLWVCDGDQDCNDASDEANCSLTTCGENQHTCVSGGACVRTSWRCDGDEDCEDGSDEADCPTTTTTTTTPNSCGENQHTCVSSGACVPTSWRCDGKEDCEDGSDEADCPTTTTTTDSGCGEDQLKCTSSGDCVPGHWHCDGVPDCLDGSDEESCPKVESDACQDNPCSHGCVEAPSENQDFFCICPEGMILQVHDRHTCVSEGTTGVKDTSYIY